MEERALRFFILVFPFVYFKKLSHCMSHTGCDFDLRAGASLVPDTKTCPALNIPNQVLQICNLSHAFIS